MDKVVVVTAFLLAVIFVVIPLGKTAMNKTFGDSVTTEYTATIVALNGTAAKIVWQEDKVFVPLQNQTYLQKEKVVDVSGYTYVKVGDELTISVTEPGLFKQKPNVEERTINVVDHELNWFKYIWRAIQK
ncbi:hypothetical protein M4D57_23280 [Brevibacillus borstelensis]|uniref:hypothetical protein n=1 Tax=Brevibacillus borstelensis TaxID=45462 RepID=UPI00046A86B2|nr:hypothetical protein [Brevibacillus borstelensis]MCC0567102.1 hypothetical protein [Brevibacillus borstelensis]MCM3561462.1 hypothetical protein [Brevibacillus borstelensis]MCM3593599.1 hypothetical protein [Brevibacillus borstelensis]MED1850040.1 hypothetical protein [Brevibacillus borstelensis]